MSADVEQMQLLVPQLAVAAAAAAAAFTAARLGVSLRLLLRLLTAARCGSGTYFNLLRWASDGRSEQLPYQGM